MGRNEAIYFYSTTDRGSARAFEGERKLIEWFRNYLIVVDAANANQKCDLSFVSFSFVFHILMIF